MRFPDWYPVEEIHRGKSFFLTFKNFNMEKNMNENEKFIMKFLNYMYKNNLWREMNHYEIADVIKQLVRFKKQEMDDWIKWIIGKRKQTFWEAIREKIKNNPDKYNP